MAPVVPYLPRVVDAEMDARLTAAGVVGGLDDLVDVVECAEAIDGNVWSTPCRCSTASIAAGARFSRVAAGAASMIIGSSVRC